jgi:predicted DNA-binding protein
LQGHKQRLQVLSDGQILITAKYENADFVENQTKEIEDFSMAEIFEIIKHIK